MAQQGQQGKKRFSCGRLIFTFIIILLILIIGFVWYLNRGGSLSIIFTIIFSVLAVVISLLQWLLSFPSSSPPVAPNHPPQASQSPVSIPSHGPKDFDYEYFRWRTEKKITNQTGSVIVYKNKADVGLPVYLLPKAAWDSKADINDAKRHPNLQTVYVKEQMATNFPLYIALFEDLEPGNYIVFTSETQFAGVTLRPQEAVKVDWH